MSKDTHNPQNLCIKLDKDKLKINSKEVILCELPCVASPLNKAIKVSLFDMVTGRIA